MRIKKRVEASDRLMSKREHLRRQKGLFGLAQEGTSDVAWREGAD